MKIHFSKFEKTAGLFVGLAFFGLCFFTIVVAVKQGWFTSRHYYRATFGQGEGIHSGSMVQIAGLRAGTVDLVSLTDENLIEVKFHVSHEFKKRIKQDSIARVIRPFVIGDKVIEVSVGSKNLKELAENQSITTEETTDLMDMLGGGKLGPYFKQLDSLVRNIQVIVEAFSDPKRSHALIGMFDQALPTMIGIRELSDQMTTHKNLKTSLANLSALTGDLNTIMPEMLEFSKNLPALSATGSKTMAQLAVLTTELNKILPSLTAVAPQLPEASQKSVEALKEAVIVLRAMQKSFLLKGAVKDVREEDALKLKEQEQKREPAEAK